MAFSAPFLAQSLISTGLFLGGQVNPIFISATYRAALVIVALFLLGVIAALALVSKPISSRQARTLRFYTAVL